ncbi:MAG: TetR/AcrR family transcriptional regulator [Candidatus Hydrogenedentota bacterium]|nr:MAG: TetR/AcrR family transcriptional regulator [Candidatus Hydrogenedentota bacterium]
MVKFKRSSKSEKEARKDILIAARDEFAAHGFAATSVEKIARKAKVPKSLVFYYFKSKKNLYQTLLRAIVAHPEPEKSLSYLTDESLEEPIRLRMLIELMCMNMTQMPETEKKILLWEMAEGRENLRTLAQELFIPRLEVTEDLLKSGIQKGYFKTTDTLLFLWSLIAFIMFYNMQKETYEGTAFYHRLYEERGTEELKNFALRHFFLALGWPEEKPIPEIPQEWRDKMQEITCHTNFLEEEWVETFLSKEEQA